MSENILPLEFDSFPASYYVISRLGYGSFGCAFLTKYRRDMATLLEGEPRRRGTLMEPLNEKNAKKLYSSGLMAVKVMKTRLKKPADYLALNEVRFILAVSAHPNLLQIFNLFIDTFSGKLHISMEAMNQNLFQFLEKNRRRPLSDLVVKSILSQLLNAIRHIHSHGYFHRDVKPENILITSSAIYYGSHSSSEENKRDPFVLKLCDYGLARHIDDTRDLTQYVSTRWYRAPEILLRLKKYSFPIDIWAFASVAVEVVNSRPLFAGLNETDQLWQVLKDLGNPSMCDRCEEDLGGDWTEAVGLAERMGFLLPYVEPSSIYSIIDHTRTELGPVIQLCLMWDPEKRPTAPELARMSYFKDTVVYEEEESPELGHLTLLDSEILEQESNNSAFSSHYIVKPLAAVSGALKLAPDAESQNFDLYSDPVYFYNKWSRSASDADISCEDSYQVAPSVLASKYTTVHGKSDDSVPKITNMPSIKALEFKRFRMKNDVSSESNGILC